MAVTTKACDLGGGFLRAGDQFSRIERQCCNSVGEISIHVATSDCEGSVSYATVHLVASSTSLTCADALEVKEIAMEQGKKRTLGLVALTLGAFMLPHVSSAQSMPAPGQDEEGWRHTLGLYMFTPLSTTGSSTINGNTVPVDMNLRDVLELLEFAAAGRYEAWHGDFGLIFDANYVGIGSDGTLPGPGGAAFDVDVRQKWLGLMAAYRVIDGTYGASGRRFTFDIQGGARYNNVRQEVKIGAAPTAGGDESWWEPVVGARGMWRLNDKWTTVASLDLGGFGASGNDLQIGANIGFDYQPWDNTALTFGYRYYSMDYSTTLATGAFAYDTEQHGPYMGVKFFF